MGLEGLRGAWSFFFILVTYHSLSVQLYTPGTGKNFIKGGKLGENDRLFIMVRKLNLIRERAFVSKDWTRGSVIQNLLLLSWPMIVLGALYSVNLILEMIWVGEAGDSLHCRGGHRRFHGITGGG